MFSAGNLSPLVREIKPSVVSNGQEMSGEDWDPHDSSAKETSLCSTANQNVNYSVACSSDDEDNSDDDSISSKSNGK